MRRGVPISGEAGVGYSLVKGYHLPPVMLTADEASALFLGAELARKLTDASLAGPVTQALDKLRAVLPRDRKQQIETLGRRTVVLSRAQRQVGSRPDEGGLMCVQEAVVAQKVLSLTYRARGKEEPTERCVEPLGIVFYGGGWTLVAWCRLRLDYRHFRIDRMERIQILPESFPTRTDFNLTAHIEAEDRAAKTQPARIWLAKSAFDRARVESTATLVKERERNGGAEYAVFTYSIEWLARWVLSFGAEAEGLEPQELRDTIAKDAEAIAKRHRKAL